MTTIAIDAVEAESLGEQHETQRPALSSVANPRRTTWTGYAKHAPDRLPAT